MPTHPTDSNCDAPRIEGEPVTAIKEWRYERNGTRMP